MDHGVKGLAVICGQRHEHEACKYRIHRWGIVWNLDELLIRCNNVLYFRGVAEEEVDGETRE